MSTRTTEAASTTELVSEYMACKNRMAEIETELRGLAQGRHEAGKHTVTIAPNRRFDKARFEKEYPPEAAPELYYQETRDVLDVDKVDDLTRDAYTKESAPKIIIK